MFFLKGVPKFLFIPLAEAVIFAMIASYILARTLVPTLAMFLLKPHDEHAKPSSNIFSRFQRGFERLFLRFRDTYHSLLEQLVLRRKVFVPTFLLLCVCVFVLVPFLGQDFFPESDSGHFILHVRAKTGTRVADTARLPDEVEQHILRCAPSYAIDD